MLDSIIDNLRFVLSKQCPVRLFCLRGEQKLVVLVVWRVNITKGRVDEPELPERVECEGVNGLDIFRLRRRGSEKVGCSSMFLASRL